jgi:hypothetical protein
VAGRASPPFLFRRLRKKKEDEMSKINGDKARQNIRHRKQAKMRVRNQALKATMQIPLKTTIKPDISPAAAPAK